jgi:hypothetical protein
MGSKDLGNATAEAYFLNNLSQAVVLPLQNDGQWKNSRLRIILGGRVQTTVNTAFSVQVYFGSSTTFGLIPVIASATKIFTTNYVTVNNKKTNWQIDINIFWDGDAKTFDGNTFGQMGNTILGQNTLSGVPSADPNLHNASNSFQGLFYGLGFTGIFNSSSTGNHAFLDVCSLELL